MNFNDYKKLILEGKQEDAFVVYAGKFQPFHINHYKTYLELVGRFGKERVYIATASLPKKPEKGKHVLDFKGKQRIITAHDIDEANVVQETNVYNPKAIKSKFPEDIPYITVVGKKDDTRFSPGGYFSYLKDDDVDPNNLEGWGEKGYIFIAENQDDKFEGEVVTGTLIRSILSGTDEEVKDKLLSSVYGKLDNETKNFIKQKYKGGDAKEEGLVPMGQSDKNGRVYVQNDKGEIKPLDGDVYDAEDLAKLKK